MWFVGDTLNTVFVAFGRQTTYSYLAEVNLPKRPSQFLRTSPRCGALICVHSENELLRLSSCEAN